MATIWPMPSKAALAITTAEMLLRVMISASKSGLPITSRPQNGQGPAILFFRQKSYHEKLRIAQYSAQGSWERVIVSDHDCTQTVRRHMEVLVRGIARLRLRNATLNARPMNKPSSLPG